MAERHPGWVDGIDAAEARLATGLLVAANGVADALGPMRVRSGIRDAPGYPGRVAVSGTKATVNAFQAVIADDARPAGGAYLVTMDTQKELTLGAAHQSLYRMDLVVAEVLDTDPGLLVSVYPGDNSASATPPRPAVTNPLSLVLGEVTVPPATTGAPSAKDTRWFTAALNAIIPVLGEADRPPNPHGSMIIFRLDTRKLEVRTSEGWTTYRPPRGSVDTWHTPSALSNGWVNYNAGYPQFGYTITEDGWVHLRGLIKSGVFDTTATKQIFTLPNTPINYRPVTHHLFPAAVPPAGNPPTGRIDVWPDGKVVAVHGTNGYLSLDGISFATY
ncbi:hypothetical protein [Actinophytocola oryzae]|uniref:Uncharacterized protein n=1 Tax=Actinophytocola oryzae TaxID=502181 RepID=A0A4R7VF56_9PSEU|nr:hypothetical protein [Actinophytocola oryzae]TDV47852.1 hypothetical protein CLV71_10987 [Actinophytocola oryzae]